MASEEVARSDFQETKETEGGRVTARFKNPRTGEDNEKNTEKDIEKDGESNVIIKKNEQLDPLEQAQKDYHDSEKNKNFIKTRLYKFLLYFVLPILGVLITVVCGFWIYQLSNLAGPTSSNTNEIVNLKKDNDDFNSRIKTIEDRLYNLVNEKNNSLNIKK
jgi:hypothetical protein